MRGSSGGGEDSICVLQLTEAGDLFYQVLRPALPELSAGPDAAGPDPPPLEEEADRPGVSPSQRRAREPCPDWVAEDTGSEEEMIGPTQTPAGPPVVPETPERGRGSGSSSEEDGLGVKRGRYLGLEVVVNEEEGEADAAAPVVAMASNALGEVASSTWMDRMAPPSVPAADAWRRWSQQLLRCRSLDRTKPTARKWRQAKKGAAHDPITEDRLQSLRRALGDSMSSGSLLLHSATSLPAVALPQLPATVRPKAWSDDLSQRLTVSWQGEEQWKRWWSDKLGLNRKERAEALKRRRSRDKAKRRSNRSLSGSSLANPGSSWGWSDPDDALSRWSEPGSPRSTVSQSGRWSEPGSPKSTVSQTAHWSEPGSPRSTVSQYGRWSEPDSPRSTVSRASQLQHWSPGFCMAGSLPNPKVSPHRV